MQDEALLTHAADIVAAHVANNEVAADALPELIRAVHDALAGLGEAPAGEAPQAEAPKPAMSVRQSLASPDKIISLIDGKRYSTLKRHIARHGYTPESYRKAFGLKPDYPMTAPAYSARRQELAKSIGLGRRTREQESAPEAPVKKARKTLKLALGEARKHLGTDKQDAQG